MLRAFAVLAAGTAVCGCATAAATREPNTLVVVYPADANTLNPLYANNEPSNLFDGLLFDGLSQPDSSFNYVPWLARSWSSTPDHLHWEVELRRGVRWSDGARFDSRDVIFTWKTMLDPKVGYPYAGMFAYVKRVTAQGPDRVRFDLSAANVLFVAEGLNAPILPEHILGKIPAAQQRISTFGEHPVGTGPYMLASWHHDDTVVFVRNPHWWHGPAKIRQIDFRIVLDGNARIDAMADGSADLFPKMSPADFQTLREIAPQLRYGSVPDLFCEFILTNDTLPGLADLAVRQAMMYGWDREAVADGLYHGDIVLNDSLTPWALTNWHDAHVPAHPFDPVRARSILDAAGWRPGTDGVRRRGDVRLAFTLKISTGDSQLTDTGSAFAADMRAIGIGIDIQQLDYATFADQTSSLRYELALQFWGGVADPDQFTFFDSSQVVPVGNNQTGYRNARVDEDLRAGLVEFNVARRRAIYDDYQRVTSATLPVVWGFDQKFNVSYAPRLRIDQRVAMPDLYFWSNVYDWQLSS